MLLKPKDRPRMRREAVKIYPDGREVCDLTTHAGRKVYWCRIEMMWARQKGKCGLQLHAECRKYPWIPLREATFDHGIPRGMGGANRDDRPFVNGNCAACSLCNCLRGSRRKENL